MADFAIRGPIARADLPGLCDRVCKLLAAGGDVVTCDVAGVEPDAVTVEAIARLQLAALRRGCRVELVNASSELRGLVDFLGLRDVISPAAGAARRAGRSSSSPGRT
jgi:ABC-type transporter Mla MlaB component